MKQLFYAGIGSRETPESVQFIMTSVASMLEAKHWVLRSGWADGADSAFEKGVVDRHNMEIYLPGSYFNGKTSRNRGYVDSTSLPKFNEAMETAGKFHPAPDRLTEFSRKLMARNAMQVLGPDLDTHSNVVIAWTPNGEVRGGTGQALRIASFYGIPVLNLGKPETLKTFRDWVSGGPEPDFVLQ